MPPSTPSTAHRVSWISIGAHLDAAQDPTYAAAMSRKIELHGHRGARGLFPENTMAGFSAHWHRG